VVLGNGIAGVTAADFVRRGHPDCEIVVIGKEAHLLYNRMGISRLVYGRSAMKGLYLLPDSWYDDNRIVCWLNTRVRRIDAEGKKVVLATGEDLAYDRLILATGSSSFVPPIAGYGLPGSFVLREADDAIAIRRYAQEHGSETAVVAGGGLLGLEAAHALHRLGLTTTVVELAPRLLPNFTDERASALLTEYLENLGIAIQTGTSIAAVNGNGDGDGDGTATVASVTLANGRVLSADVFLVAAGITPNVDLAREAGLEVNRGVVVDDGMRTSDPSIFAAGDVAEIGGRVLGLWPIAVNQAEVAARNAVGADDTHAHVLPVALLKGVGIDLLSAGRITVDHEAGEEAVVVDHGREHQYAKLVLAADGRVVGGLLLNRSAHHSALITAVKESVDVSGVRDQLRAGDLAALSAPSSDRAQVPVRTVLSRSEEAQTTTSARGAS
jgi:NAD(P)H-nitrite reductase large subunit